jgi:DNA-binding Lrp family transcriptional regulator
MSTLSLTKQANGGTLDAIDRKLLALLQDNAKLSQAELAKAVGLTAPSVNERIHKLERGENLFPGIVGYV